MSGIGYERDGYGLLDPDMHAPAHVRDDDDEPDEFLLEEMLLESKVRREELDKQAKSSRFRQGHMKFLM